MPLTSLRAPALVFVAGLAHASAHAAPPPPAGAEPPRDAAAQALPAASAASAPAASAPPAPASAAAATDATASAAAPMATASAAAAGAAREPSRDLKGDPKANPPGDWGEDPHPDWEAALGAVLSYQPAYAGASEHVWKVRPAFLLRYKRLAISNTAGMTTRRRKDVMSGLSYNLVDEASRWRVDVALRYDQGRSDNDSAWLNGVGSVQDTLRVRVGASYQLTPEWRATTSWSQDMLRRGSGGLGDVGIVWERRAVWFDGWPPLTLGANMALSVANGQYMRAFYGVNAEQSAASGHPIYEPGSGLRNVSVNVGLRGDVTRDWGMLIGASASRQLGPAAASPLTLQPFGWSVSAGVIRRF